MQKITPFLWYTREAEEAAAFYASIFPDSRVTRVTALLDGGSAEQCGWLKDCFGLSWQIVPTVLGEMMAQPERDKAKRASDAMMKMVKIDIAGLQAAFSGATGGSAQGR
jgi:predicted 3-demethylubiquinone-9 3-methyltransferase (glyoxalase superfamily)